MPLPRRHAPRRSFQPSSPAHLPNRRAALLAGLGAAGALLTGCELARPVNVDAARGAAPNPGHQKLRIAHGYEPTHPIESVGIAQLRTQLAEVGIDVLSYPSGQLGSEAELLEQVATGALDMAFAGASFLGMWLSEAAVLDAIYLFENVEQFHQATDGPIVSGVYDRLEETSGLRVASSWYYGSRDITSNRPIRKPADLRGLKIRTPDAPLYLTSFSVLGATATPMALSEVYLGLQQGTIDAQENPIPTIASAKFYEPQDYLNLTSHIIQGTNMVTTARAMSAFSPGQQAAIAAALDEARALNRRTIEENEQRYLDEWSATGAITIVDDVDTDAFRELAASKLPERVPWGDTYLALQKSVEGVS